MKTLGIIGIVISGLGLLSAFTVTNDPTLFAMDMIIYGYFLTLSIIVVKNK